MPRPYIKVTDDAFAAAWRQGRGHVATVAKILGWTERSTYRRREKTEQRLGYTLPSGEDRTGRAKVSLSKIGHRVEIKDIHGTIIVFSDPHWWPKEERSAAFTALTQICRDLRPVVLVANGDLFDGARISRFPTGWSEMPTVKDEIEIVHHRLSEIVESCPKDTLKVWCMGNHDSRMSLRLAQVAPEFEGVHGLDLKDHFDDLDFTFAWSVLINGKLFIKHRYRSGEHAGHNNTIRAGCTIATGHDHTLKVSPFIDIHGIRWGVTCGSLSEHGPDVAKFSYQEDNPSQHNQGFAVFTIAQDGTLLPPELVQVLNGKAYFRGREVHR